MSQHFTPYDFWKKEKKGLWATIRRRCLLYSHMFTQKGLSSARRGITDGIILRGIFKLESTHH